MISKEALNRQRHLMPICEKTIALYNKYGGLLKKDATLKELKDYQYYHAVLISKGIKYGHDTIAQDMTMLQNVVEEIKRLQKIG